MIIFAAVAEPAIESFHAHRPRGPRAVLPVALLAVLTFVLVVATRSAQQTGDALLYAWSIRTGEDLFHPHHLLYAPAVRGIYLALAPFVSAERWDALAAAQLHGAAWAAVAVACLFTALRRITGRAGVALAGALALLFSQGFWMLSTHANSYVAAVGCLCVLLDRLARVTERSAGDGGWVAVSLAWGAAVLYHQVNVLLAVALVAAAWIHDGRLRRGTLARVLAPATVVVLAAYGTVVASGWTGTAAKGLVRYSLDYALHPNPTWGTFGHLGPSGIGALVSNMAWGLVALHRSVGPAVAALVALSIAAVAIWNVRRVRAGGEHAAIRVFLLAWLALDLAFFLWWLPQHKPFFLLAAVPSLALATVALADLSRPRSRGVAAAVAIVVGIGAFHLFAVILPLHATERPAVREAAALDREVDPSCYVMAPYEVAQSLRYYFDRARSAHARFPLLCAYQDEPVPEVFDIREGECVVVALPYLRPDRELYGFDGFNESDRWLGWLDWLLGVRSGDAGIECRRFRAFRTGTGAAYLAIAPERQRFDGRRELLSALDDVCAPTAGWADRPFVAWHDAVTAERAPETNEGAP